MAEPSKNKKPSLRQLLNEIAEDEEFSEEERYLAVDQVKELDFQDWCKRQLKESRKESK